MVRSLCTLCISNYGVRREAEVLTAKPSGAPCPNCLKVGSGVIDSSAAEAVLHQFFVRGSIRRGAPARAVFVVEGSDLGCGHK